MHFDFICYKLASIATLKLARYFENTVLLTCQVTSIGCVQYVWTAFWGLAHPSQFPASFIIFRFGHSFRSWENNCWLISFTKPRWKKISQNRHDQNISVDLHTKYTWLKAAVHTYAICENTILQHLWIHQRKFDGWELSLLRGYSLSRIFGQHGCVMS